MFNQLSPTKNVDLQAMLRWLSEGEFILFICMVYCRYLRAYAATRGTVCTVSKGLLLDIIIDDNSEINKL